MSTPAKSTAQPAKASRARARHACRAMPMLAIEAAAVLRYCEVDREPAEFIVLRISQDTRALEAELAGAGG